MTTKARQAQAHYLNVGDLRVEVVRKPIKNLHLAVYPPDGRVRVAAPLRVNDDAVRAAVLTRLAWIRKQQQRMAEQPRYTPREYVSGESHYFQGHRYLLNVVERPGPPHVAIRNLHTLELCVRPGSDRAAREQVILAWHRAALKAEIPLLIAKWEPVLGVQVADWGVKRMKTRWGSCSVKARRIWLNLDLIQKPPHCLEYVVVHEMAHLLVPNHGPAFVAILDKHLPTWRQSKEALNQFPIMTL